MLDCLVISYVRAASSVEMDLTETTECNIVCLIKRNSGTEVSGALLV